MSCAAKLDAQLRQARQAAQLGWDRPLQAVVVKDALCRRGTYVGEQPISRAEPPRSYQSAQMMQSGACGMMANWVQTACVTCAQISQV